VRSSFGECVAGDGGEEVGPLECVQARLCRRGHRRRPWHVTHESDLAEVVARAALLLAVLEPDPNRAGVDEVEAVAYVTGAAGSRPLVDLKQNDLRGSHRFCS